MRKLKHILQDALIVVSILVILAASCFTFYELVRLFGWLP